MLESQGYKSARETVDNLANSFLRGSRFDSHDARLQLLARLKTDLARCSERERGKLRNYAPTASRVFQGEQKSNYQSWITEAFRTR